MNAVRPVPGGTGHMAPKVGPSPSLKPDNLPLFINNKISRRSNGHDYISGTEASSTCTASIIIIKKIVIPSVWVEEPSILDSSVLIQASFCLILNTRNIPSLDY